MQTRAVVYVCKNDHELSFGHNIKRNGSSESGSPAVCLTCMTPYVYAKIKL
jgi:hypothetical protein